MCELLQMTIWWGEIQPNRGVCVFFLYFISTLIPRCWKLLMNSQELSGRESVKAPQVTFFSKQLPEMISFSTRAQRWSQNRRQLEGNLSMQTGKFPKKKSANCSFRRASRWQLDLFGRVSVPGLCLMSPSLPHSLHFLPTRSEIIFSGTLRCTDNIWFPSSSARNSPQTRFCRRCICKCVC